MTRHTKDRSATKQPLMLQEPGFKESLMRTTLDIDDAVLEAVKELARREGRTAGAVLSALARQALTGSKPATSSTLAEAPAHYGFRPFAGTQPVTNTLVDRLRDEQGV